MNRKLLLLPVVVLGLGLSACAANGGYYYYRTPPPPPPPRAAYMGVAPGPGFVWIDGLWDWHGSRYSWVPGRWMRPPRRHAVWVPGNWQHEGRRYNWRRGYWR